MITVTPGTILIFSDIACPWAHLSIYRLWTAREQLGLEDEVRFDHSAFPLEMVNEQATPKRHLDAEIPVIAGLDLEAGWHPWNRPDWEYPGSSLLALEAVQAANRQGLQAGEEVDRALRKGFFEHRRNISMRHEILALSAECPEVDPAKLTDDLDNGVARIDVIRQQREAEGDAVKGSPHLFFADGGSVHNPGIQMHMTDAGFPVIDKDDRDIYTDLIQRAARTD